MFGSKQRHLQTLLRFLLVSLHTSKPAVLTWELQKHQEVNNHVDYDNKIGILGKS